MRHDVGSVRVVRQENDYQISLCSNPVRSMNQMEHWPRGPAMVSIISRMCRG